MCIHVVLNSVVWDGWQLLGIKDQLPIDRTEVGVLALSRVVGPPWRWGVANGRTGFWEGGQWDGWLNLLYDMRSGKRAVICA